MTATYGDASTEGEEDIRISARLVIFALLASVLVVVPVTGNTAPPVAACYAAGAAVGPVVNNCPVRNANGRNFTFGVVPTNRTSWLVVACNKGDRVCVKRQGTTATFGTIRAPAPCPCHPHIFVTRGVGYIVSTGT